MKRSHGSGRPEAGFLAGMSGVTQNTNGLWTSLWKNSEMLCISDFILWVVDWCPPHVSKSSKEFLEKGCACRIRSTTNVATPSFRGERDRTETEDPSGEVLASLRQPVTRLAGSDGPTGRAVRHLNRSTVGLLKLIL